VTNQPRHPQSSRHPQRPPPAARRAPAVLGTFVLSIAVPAALAAPPPTEPPPGPPPLPPAGPTPGLPLWAVLVIVGGTITLAAATTLITLALQPGHRCKPPPPTHTSPARPTHQPPPAARPGAREHTSTATPPNPPHPPAAGTRRQLPTSTPQHRRPS
jgi:hypothetical protein